MYVEKVVEERKGVCKGKGDRWRRERRSVWRKWWRRGEGRCVEKVEEGGEVCGEGAWWSRERCVEKMVEEGRGEVCGEGAMVEERKGVS